MEGESQDRHRDVMELLRAIALSQQRLEALLSRPEALEAKEDRRAASKDSRNIIIIDDRGATPDVKDDGEAVVVDVDDRDAQPPVKAAGNEHDAACSGEASCMLPVMGMFPTVSDGMTPKSIDASHDLTKSIALMMGDKSEKAVRLQSSQSRRRLLKEDDSGSEMGGPVANRGVVHPDSRIIAFMDICVMGALALELVLSPYQIAWKDYDAPPLVVMNRVLVAFWLVDLLLGFNVGFYNKGEVVLERRRITKRYVCTMFIPNLLAVVADLTSALLMEYSTHSPPRWVAIIPRILKVERVVCSLARIRKWRLKDKLEMLFPRVLYQTLVSKIGLGQQATAMKRVVEMVVIMLWLNHLGACLWQLVGESATNEWAEEQYGMTLSRDGLVSYLNAYLWSTQAMISGGLLVFPKTSGQALVSIIIIQVGVMICSIIVGILADTLLELRARNKEWTEDRGKLRFYMEQGNVPSSFAMSLEEEIQEIRAQNSQHLSEDEVKLLESLSQTSKDRLRELVFGHVVSSEAFIRSCVALCKTVVGDVCTNCLSRNMLLSGQTAFEANTPSQGAYLALWGTFEYIPCRPCTKVEAKLGGHDGEDRRESFVSAVSSIDEEWREPSEVENLTWLCQLALFCSVHHSGSMVACARGECLRIDGDRFRQVVLGTPKLAEVATHYGRAIVEAFEKHPDQQPCDISPSVGHVQILSMMPARTRGKMSRAGLVLAGQMGGLFGGGKGFSALQDEVQAGKCDLVVESKFAAWNEPPKEVVRRTAAVAVLRLAHPDGRLLAQIGKIKDGKIIAQVELPGKKVKAGEFPLDTMKGIMGKTLPNGMEDRARIKKHDLVQEVKPSSSFSVETRYFRHVFHADLDEHAEASFAAACSKLAVPNPMDQSSSGECPERRVSTESPNRRKFSNESPNRRKGSNESPNRRNVRHHESPTKHEDVGAFLMRPDAEVLFAWLKPQDLEDPRIPAAVEAVAAHYAAQLHAVQCSMKEAPVDTGAAIP